MRFSPEQYFPPEKHLPPQSIFPRAYSPEQSNIFPQSNIYLPRADEQIFPRVIFLAKKERDVWLVSLFARKGAVSVPSVFFYYYCLLDFDL